MTRHVTQGRDNWQTKPAMTEARRREVFGPLSTEPQRSWAEIIAWSVVHVGIAAIAVWAVVRYSL